MDNIIGIAIGESIDLDRTFDNINSILEPDSCRLCNTVQDKRFLVKEGSYMLDIARTLLKTDKQRAVIDPDMLLSLKVMAFESRACAKKRETDGDFIFRVALIFKNKDGDILYRILYRDPGNKQESSLYNGQEELLVKGRWASVKSFFSSK